MYIKSAILDKWSVLCYSEHSQLYERLVFSVAHVSELWWMGCSDTVAVAAFPTGGEMLALSLYPGIVTTIVTVVIAINAIFIEL